NLAELIEEITKERGILSKVDDSIATDYAKRTGIDKAEILTMMVRLATSTEPALSRFWCKLVQADTPGMRAVWHHFRHHLAPLLAPFLCRFVAKKQRDIRLDARWEGTGGGCETSLPPCH
ncbi:MAG: hypothetical protein PHO07_09860, partial [Pirellulales bacterium]|nr:hypothetical protein [Pirellulales bacterium]